MYMNTHLHFTLILGMDSFSFAFLLLWDSDLPCYSQTGLLKTTSLQGKMADLTSEK